MKRVPLTRKTPMKRSDKGLKKTELKRGGRLRNRSKKATAKHVDRKKLVADLMDTYSTCQACAAWAAWDGLPSKHRPPVDAHEMVLRSQGGDILDERIILCVCRPCHSRIDDTPIDAELLGLYLRSYHYDEEHIAEAHRVRESWANGQPDEPFYFTKGPDDE
jgi:hypothetical protein